MTTAGGLERPSVWAPRWGRLLLIVGVGSALAVVALAMLALGVTDSTAPIGMRILNLGFGLFGVALVFAIAVTLGRTFPRSSARGVGLATDDDGTPVLRIRQSRSGQVLLGIAVLLCGVSSLLIGTSMLVLSGGIAPAGVLLVACGAYLVGGVLVAVAAGAPLAELRLGRDVVRLRTLTTHLSAGWDDVVAVEPTGQSSRRRVQLVALDIRQERTWLSWTRLWPARRELTSIEIRCEWFGVDPVRLYRLLDFYRCDRHARSELGTEASVRRVSDARFPRFSSDRP